MSALPPAEIFKAYDIRGIVGRTLTVDGAYQIGRALGSQAREESLCSMVIGRDGRLSGPALAQALARGIMDTGVDVVDIGVVPTPVTYFAAEHLGVGSCVSVTGSHNPPDYNGFKMVLGGQTLFAERIGALRERIESARWASGQGVYCRTDVRSAYIQRITSDIILTRPMRIAIDCGNGVAGAIAPALFDQLGCAVQPLFCEVDGHFPNHHPDPSKPENLRDLITAVRETDAELGLAFDGDGDRLGVVTKDGEIIYPDRQLMLFAADILLRHPGATIIHDVKCSRWVSESVRHQGGQPLMWKTGHAFIKGKLKETGALLAGEMSGHIFFKERWYGFDDGLYAAARLLEIISRWDDANWPLKNLPCAVSTPEINIPMCEGEPHRLIDALQKRGKFPRARALFTLDGVRAEYADGFGLARASNTTPVLVLRFEADTTAGIERIQEEFKNALRDLWPGLKLDAITRAHKEETNPSHN
jgi:phosphomannomutase/phosphoglucomutase